MESREGGRGNRRCGRKKIEDINKKRKKKDKRRRDERKS